MPHDWPWEETVPISEEVVKLVAADVVTTLGWSPEMAQEFVRRHGGGSFAPGEHPVISVAESVQQYLHDDRIDTSWPRCPVHPHHPLRLTGTLPALWTCPATGRSVCRLGELPAREEHP